MNKLEIASFIDNTVLAAQATEKQIVDLCKESAELGCASVCVNPCYVKLAAKELADSKVKVCTVIGFPLGANTSEVKAFEAARAVAEGADEVDMVINVGAATEGKYDYVESDIAAVVKASKEEGKKLGREVIVKVILETCLISDEVIVKTSECSKRAGADFVKTSTGFATPKDKDGKLLPNGATVEAVALMRKTVGPDMGVKASGGIRTAETAAAMIKAGASRIGASSGKKIVDGCVE